MIEAADNFIAADVMELADMQDLGSCAARRAGSSPVIRIKTPERRFRGFLRMETLNPGMKGGKQEQKIYDIIKNKTLEFMFLNVECAANIVK